MSGNNTFTISSQPFYDQYNQCYMNIMSVNMMPKGPLQNFVRRLQMPKLSPYQGDSVCDPIEKCALAIFNVEVPGSINGNTRNLMHTSAIPNLVSFLLNNGYQFETQITNMLTASGITQTNKRLCFTVTYFGDNQPNIVYNR